MTDYELLEFNCQGFIPGPLESEEHFVERVKQMQENFETSSKIPAAHWDWINLFLKEMFDFEPKYFSVFYSNHSLRPWQGAAAWIDEKNISSIQLRTALEKGSYLGIYKREEILSHEAVHSARSAFQEASSEEFFAYMTSEKKWHRVLGPIIKSPWEIWPFFLSMILGSFYPLIYYFGAVWLTIGFVRLIKQHQRIKKAFQNILKSVESSKVARAILFRLTDHEILLFSRGKKIEEYSNQQQCLRWRLIRLAYLKK